MNEFKIDITVKQFLNKFFLSSIDWVYCHVYFPDDKFQELGGKWEVSQVAYPTKDREDFNIFLDFWGNLNVFKAEIINNGLYVTGDKLEGVGIILHVDYKEGVFK